MTTGSEEGQGTDKSLELVFYGEKGHSGPHVIGDQEGFSFSNGNTDLFEVIQVYYKLVKLFILGLPNMMHLSYINNHSYKALIFALFLCMNTFNTPT